MTRRREAHTSQRLPVAEPVAVDRRSTAEEELLELARQARRKAGFDPDADPATSTLTQTEVECLGAALGDEIVAGERGETFSPARTLGTVLRRLRRAGPTAADPAVALSGARAVE